MDVANTIFSGRKWALWLARRVRKQPQVAGGERVARELPIPEAPQKSVGECGRNKFCVEVLPVTDAQSQLARRRSEKSAAMLSNRFASLSSHFENTQTRVETSPAGQNLRREIGELVQHGARLFALAHEAEIIAGQANLLALNAAIEAAKTGGNGGLSALADEMGKISDQNAENARHLAQLAVNTRQTIDATSRVSEALVNGEVLTESTRQLEIFATQMRYDSEAIGGEIAEALIALQAMSEENRILSEKHETARDCFGELARQITHFDTLTNLPNRRSFMQKLKTLIAEAGDNGGEVALLHIGLDRFSDVNEKQGFETGDLLLIEVASRLNACAQNKGLTARLSGDEFLLAIAGQEEMRTWWNTALSVSERLGQPYCLNGHEVNLSVSIGIAAYPTDANNADLLFVAARRAMRAAKATGRNTLHFYSDEIEKRAASGAERVTRETE